MDVLARIGLLTTCVLAVYVGVRTLLIWQQTRGLEELCLGLNLTALSVGGLILAGVNTFSAATGLPYPRIPYALGLLALVVHAAALYAGSWRIFRPYDHWPVLFVVAATALATLWMVLALAGDVGRSEFRSILMLSIRGAGMAWAAVECFLYSAKMRRRAALGLSDPMVAHRIWLWALSASAFLASIGFELGSWVYIGEPLTSWTFGMHMMSFFGILGSTALALAFFPPEAYRRWIEARLNPPAAGRGPLPRS